MQPAQAQLRLGKPLCIAPGQSPDAIRHAGRVVAGILGLSELQSLFHGEHDAQEPTKVKRGQGGGRASALAPELQQPPRATLPRDGRPIGADISRRPGWSATTLWQSSYLAAGQAAQAAPIGTDIAPLGRRPLPGQSEQQPTNAHLMDLAAGGCHSDHRRTWGENVRTFVQTHWATCAGVRAGVCAGNCAGACAGRARAVGRPNAGMALWVLGLANHFSHWPARRGRARAFAAAACVANAAAAIERIAFWL